MRDLDLGHPAGFRAATVPKRFGVPRSEHPRAQWPWRRTRRGEVHGNIGFSGSVALVWFAVEDERCEVRVSDFVSATAVS